MSLFSLIAATLLEYFQPLFMRKHLCGWLPGYADFFRHHFNAGEYGHGKFAWLLAVLPLIFCLVWLSRWLGDSHPVFAWALNVLVLYASLGFSQFSRILDAIQRAVQGGKMGEARDLLSKWCGKSCHELDADEIVRLAVEQALLAALQHLFGVVLWFALFSLLGLGGAAGALGYCLAIGLSAGWAGKTGEDEIGAETFDRFAQLMLYLLEWLPIRLTAATFALVGNFEDTAYCWRSQAATWADREKGILLASAAGALGVRLGLPLMLDGKMLQRPELGIGGKAELSTLGNTTRLIWRTTIVWLFVLLLLALAGLLG
ncbi:MAG: threonine-phosphate decarboxylase [Gallionellales bacterium CG_4_10_14_3_um_filter_54_96]|nr:MAG: threonine-phosphate decarboxylase [Gallionellales bacterium CG03_land_8_20_14_0_80_55_15]PIY05015.1 MAG: threonine-phosphate decarboxylase [Gallionellales bacterium CG_4_10_14_3_um_filter_54_96]